MTKLVSSVDVVESFTSQMKNVSTTSLQSIRGIQYASKTLMNTKGNGEKLVNKGSSLLLELKEYMNQDISGIDSIAKSHEELDQTVSHKMNHSSIGKK